MAKNDWVIIAGIAGLAIFGGGTALSTISSGASSIVQKIANAIATAEGFFTPGTLPNRS